MKRLVVMLSLAAIVSACGSSPTAPTPPPIPTANLSFMGNLNVTACTLAAAGNVYSCFAYNGAATNTGGGCASGVRGVTTTYDVTTRAMIDASNWSYGNVVRPNEQIVYNGLALRVVAPLTGGWYYTTTIAWDNVRCP